MPIISSFFGINVRMYFADHPPPHIHIEYQGHEALVALADGAVIEGSLPSTGAGPSVVHRPPARTDGQLGQGPSPTVAEPHSRSRQ